MENGTGLGIRNRSDVGRNCQTGRRLYDPAHTISVSLEVASRPGYTNYAWLPINVNSCYKWRGHLRLSGLQWEWVCVSVEDFT